MAAEPQHRRVTVSEFHQMGVAGILGHDDRVELNRRGKRLSSHCPRDTGERLASSVLPEIVLDVDEVLG